MKPYYFIVIIPEGGDGVMSRAAGTDKDDAIRQADARRKDLPKAESVKVITYEHGVVYQT